MRDVRKCLLGAVRGFLACLLACVPSAARGAEITEIRADLHAGFAHLGIDPNEGAEHSMDGANGLVGQRVKIRGSLESGHIVASRVKLGKPASGPPSGRVAGVVREVDAAAREFAIGPIRLIWDAETSFGDYQPDQLAGTSVQVRGELVGPANLRAFSILAPPDDLEEIEIVGTISELVLIEGGGGLARVLGVEVEIPPAVLSRTWIQLTGTTEFAAGSSKEPPRDSARELSRELEKNRPDEQATFELFGRTLTLGGELAFDSRYRGDRSIGRKPDADDELRIRVSGELEALYELHSNVTLFLKGTVQRTDEIWVEDSLEQASDHEWSIRRGQTWVYVEELFGTPIGLQVGRLAFKEKRAWWWDANIDAVRLFFHGPVGFEVAVGRELFVNDFTDSFISPRQDELLRVLVRARHSWKKNHSLSFFALSQFDVSSQPQPGSTIPSGREDSSDADLTWFGLRAMGRQKINRQHRIDYWIDTAAVWGRETVFEFDDDSGDFDDIFNRALPEGHVGLFDRFERKVSGWGLDMGVAWRTRWPCEPRLTLGYALGSGDNGNNDSRDHAFRQTGLNTNNGKFLGVDRFRYYGELLRPELSNLQIVTAALGLPLLEDSSVEFVYHYYRQVAAAPFVRGARIRTSPNGRHPEIGHELDIVLGIEEWKRVELEFVAAFFWAGRAYEGVGTRSLELRGNRAAFGTFKLKYNF